MAYIHSIRRFEETNIISSESGTGKVRSIINTDQAGWQQALELVANSNL